jgi:hypothetical protein
VPDLSEPQAVDNVLRWVLRLPRPDGASVSDDRFAESAFRLTHLTRRSLPNGVGPEQIAVPLGHLVESRQQLPLPSIVSDLPAPGVISPSGFLDGVATLAEAVERFREYAGWLRALADAGYELDGPIQEDCGVYSVHRPAADRPEPGSAPSSD